MSDVVNPSRFFMWRTLFAIVHADNVVAQEEVQFMAHVLEGIQFTDVQTAILKDDIENPKDVNEMFEGITNVNDRVEFFEFARDLVWVDGDFGVEEQSVMVQLQKKHIASAQFEDLIGSVSLELEDDAPQTVVAMPVKKKPHLQKMLSSFGEMFLGNRSNDD